MISKSKNTKPHFQKNLLSAGMVSLVLCMCFWQQALPPSYESKSSTDCTMTSKPGWVTSMTLKVCTISPQEGDVLTNFPTDLEVKVTRGGLPVQGVRVQFWMMGGSHDAEMHNAFLTMTDSSGNARLHLLNQNTLEPSRYMWYADAIMPGFKAGASKPISFVIPSSSTKGVSTYGGKISTDKNEYSVLSGDGTKVVIHGNVNGYHLGEPIILKIESPSGKIVQMVQYGTYLGAFQNVYKLGQDSKLGSYTVTVYYNYVVSSSTNFHVVK